MVRGRRQSVLAVLVLVMGLAPLGTASAVDAGRDLGCLTLSNETFSASALRVQGDTCLVVQMGTLLPGTWVEFVATVTNEPLDLLMFTDNAYAVYNNKQRYRIEDVWVDDVSLEATNGSIRWVWRTPTDTGPTSWNLVLDNLDHDGDDGAGGQGTDFADVVGSLRVYTPGVFELYADSHRFARNAAERLTTLSLDAGTQIAVAAHGFSGDIDVFLLSDDQLAINAQYQGINLAAILGLQGRGAINWIVPAELAGQEVHLYVDNGQGDPAGGEHTSIAQLTINAILLPVLAPDITAIDDREQIDVGESIQLSLNSTPNRSDQLAGASWDFDAQVDADGDGDLVNDEDAKGMWAAPSWSSPGIRSVTATVWMLNGLTKNDTYPVRVADATDPVARMEVRSVTYNEAAALDAYTDDEGSHEITLRSVSTDNHRIETVAWQVDGGARGTSETLVVDWGVAGQTHVVRLVVTDPAGHSDQLDMSFVVIDLSGPGSIMVDEPEAYSAGQTVRFSASAYDAQWPSGGDLTYNWDFNASLDADGDGSTRNDVQATGREVEWAFPDEGTYTVVLTVINQGGVSNEHRIVAQVGSAEIVETGGAVGPVLIIILVLAAAGAIAVGRYGASRRKLKALRTQQLIAAQAAAEAAADQQLSREEQAAMYRPGASTQDPRAAADFELAALANVGSTPEVTAANRRAADEAEIAYLAGDYAPFPPHSPAPEQPAARSGAGVDLDDVSFLDAAGADLGGGYGIGMSGQDPSPHDPYGLAVLAGTVSGGPQAVASADPVGDPDATAATCDLLQAACATCDQAFAVEIPEGAPEVIVVCPHCGQRQLYQR